MIMIKSLRLSLIAIENSLKEMINDGAASDYPEIMEVFKLVNEIRVNSKIASVMAFDEIEKSNQFMLATDNGENICVRGYSCDEFNLKLAGGIIDRVRLVEVGRKKTFSILIDS